MFMAMPQPKKTPTKGQPAPTEEPVVARGEFGSDVLAFLQQVYGSAEEIQPAKLKSESKKGNAFKKLSFVTVGANNASTTVQVFTKSNNQWRAAEPQRFSDALSPTDKRFFKSVAEGGTHPDFTLVPPTGGWLGTKEKLVPFVRLRGLFANKDLSLAPGLFVRIRLPMGAAYEATLVAEKALGTDQGQKFVYVVDKDNMVAYRRVQVGRLHHGLRAISEGLAEGDNVIVSGLQRAKPGHAVTPDMVPMKAE